MIGSNRASRAEKYFRAQKGTPEGAEDSAANPDSSGRRRLGLGGSRRGRRSGEAFGRLGPFDGSWGAVNRHHRTSSRNLPRPSHELARCPWRRGSRRRYQGDHPAITAPSTSQATPVTPTQVESAEPETPRSISRRDEIQPGEGGFVLTNRGNMAKAGLIAHFPNQHSS